MSVGVGVQWIVNKELGEKHQIRRCPRGGVGLLWDGTRKGRGHTQL